MKVVLAGAALLVLAVACGETQRAEGPYSHADVQWLGRFADWQIEYGKRLAPLQDTYRDVLEGRKGVSALRAATAPMRGCANTLSSAVGKPESERLRLAYDLLLKFCAEERTSGESLVAATMSPTEEERVAGSNASRASERFFDRASRTIDGGLRANRPLPVRAGASRDSRIEPRLSRAASTLALKKVEVRCWSKAEWRLMIREWDSYAGVRSEVDGFVNGASRVNIEPDSCATLARFVYDRWRPEGEAEFDAADAVDLLAHETQHLFNRNGDEAETECHGLQDVRRLAVLLGAPQAYAKELARYDWKYLYPLREADYRTAECGPNGLFDMHPETPGFP